MPIKPVMAPAVLDAAAFIASAWAPARVAITIHRQPLATYGRPIIYLKATDDPSGKEWAEHIEIGLSPSSHDRSCCYTRLLPIDDHSALLIYSDFNYPDKISGEPKKSVLVRKITVKAND